MNTTTQLHSTDRNFFEQHGWWIAPQVIPEELLDRAAAGIEAVHAGHREFDIPIRQKAHLDWREGSGQAMMIHNYASLLHHAIRELILWPGLGEICGYLANTNEVRLFNSTIVDKTPGIEGPANVVGWHTDRAYWQNCSSRSMFTAWIPFQDTPLELGPLLVLDGSHRWPDEGRIFELRRAKNFMTDGSLDPRAELERSGYPATPITMVLKRGQFSVHHCMAFHGSGPNRSTRNRTILTVHLQDGPNKWQRVPLAGGGYASYQHDQWCAQTPQAEPDYSDPVVCPALWRAAI